jgi:hypothetical protein
MNSNLNYEATYKPYIWKYTNNKKDNKFIFQIIAKHFQLPNLWVQICKHVIKQLKSLFNILYITFWGK